MEQHQLNFYISLGERIADHVRTFSGDNYDVIGVRV